MCGFVYYASETYRTWDNKYVCAADYEERHPQDFVRGRRDNQNVPNARPEQVDTFLGPLITNISAAASAGATTFSVDSSTRFLAADHIGVSLSNGTIERHIIQSIPSATSIEITAPLGGAVSVDGVVINYSAVSDPNYG